MCSVDGDIEDLSFCENPPNSDQNRRDFQKCKKCKGDPVVLLQKKDPFCQSCFFIYCHHKFRSTIGKTKQIKHGQKVLLACSGGRKSAALLHLTQKTLLSATKRQISFSPEILFINEAVVMPDKTQTEEDSRHIISLLLKAGYPVYYTSLELVSKINESEDYFWKVENVLTVEKFPSNLESQVWIGECIANLSLSSKVDFIKHLRLLLITSVAEKLKQDYVFVGDTATSLAVDIFADISLGRGSQIFQDTNFLDIRYSTPVCRPLREFANEEIAFFNQLNNCSYLVLPDLLTKTDPKSSIQRLSETFITHLQEDFPATVSTIFRTGNKLSSDLLPAVKTCILCKSKLDNSMPDECSALQAFLVSQELSQPSKCEVEDLSGKLQSVCLANDSAVKIIDLCTFLCHGCSSIFGGEKVQKRNLLSPISHHTTLVKMRRDQMKEDLKEFILEDNH